MRPHAIAVLALSVIGSISVACIWDSAVKPQPVQTPAAPTPVERFRQQGLFDPPCQPPLPIIVTAAGAVLRPEDAAYARAAPSLCYDTVDHALQDVPSRRPILAQATVAPVEIPTEGLVATAAAGVLTRLRTAPITSAEAPEGFSAPIVSVGSAVQNGVTKGQGLLGEVDITLSGNDAQDVIGYLVFSSDADAGAVFAGKSVATPEASNPVVFTPYGFEYPVVCKSAGMVSATGERSGVTTCYAHFGYVLVVGLSAVPDPDGKVQHGNNDHAIALAAAGVRHFERVNR